MIFITRINKKLSYLFFTKTWPQALILQIKQNDVPLLLNNILQAKEKKEEMDATKQSWEVDILYSLVRKTKFDLILHIGSIPNNYC